MNLYSIYIFDIRRYNILFINFFYNRLRYFVFLNISIHFFVIFVFFSNNFFLNNFFFRKSNKS